MIYESAEDLYRSFMGREPQGEFSLDILWPESLSVIGRAGEISYRSDKQAGGGEGYQEDYIHFHDSPCLLLCAATPGLPFFGSFDPPINHEFPVLGQCIELGYDDGMSYQYKDFLETGILPLLCADPHRGMLILCAPWGGDPLIIWGPKLLIESRGIVG